MSMDGMTRRDALAGLLSAALGTAALGGRSLAATLEDSGLAFASGVPFSFDMLKANAAAQAREPWHDPKSPYADILEEIDYTAFHQIVYRRDRALWRTGDAGAPVQLFHLGKYFKEPCSISLVESGQAREILYRQSYFEMSADHVARRLPQNVGFAGFRVMADDQTWDWLAFLGASYFRTPGGDKQYGMSARGLAIDTAMPTPEEFPRFSAFWLEAVPGQRGRVTVYAMLDGPSVTGAFRFDCARTNGVVMDVEAELHPRKPIQRLGVAPLTAMFWYSEKDRVHAVDWRPEIHDSDGLAIWTGAGERIWRPLNNPRSVMTNSFGDARPRGFGLLQRDRIFDHYQDDGVFYDRRPSVWVEPVGDWGRGAVQLVEIPTEDEIHDNIVAYWVPEEPVVPGRPLNFSYRLHWNYDEPYPTEAGRVADTFLGIGGIPGQERPRDLHKFVVDFAGGKLGEFGPQDGVTAEITASRGEIGESGSYPVVGSPGRFRTIFDLKVEGLDLVDLRLFLKSGDEALTETWIFQYFPEDMRKSLQTSPQ